MQEGIPTFVSLISFISLNLSLLFIFVFLLHLINPPPLSCSPSLFNVRLKIAYQSFIVYHNTMFKLRSRSFSQCLFLSIISFFTLYLFFLGLLTNSMIMSFVVLTNFSLPCLNLLHHIAMRFFFCLCTTCNFLFSFSIFSAPSPLAESHHILRESRAAEAKITCFITLHTQQGMKFIANSLICTNILIYQSWVVLTKMMTSELVYNSGQMMAHFPSVLIRAPLTSNVRTACIICCNIHSIMQYHKSHILNNSSLFIVNLLGSQNA